MEYKFIPDSFDDEAIEQRFGTRERFTNLQIKYKQKFESLLLPFLKIGDLMAMIQSQNVEIPLIDDSKANFYRGYSMLQNPYIYVRNNYHVENLTNEEIAILERQDIIPLEFFTKSLERVLFEEGDITFYGTPRDEVACPSQSLVFEFAYDQVKCESVEQLIEIEKVIEQCKLFIRNNLARTNIPVSFVVYDGIPKIFKDKEMTHD